MEEEFSVFCGSKKPTCYNILFKSTDPNSDIHCLLTVLFIFKFANHRRKEFFVSTANKPLVGTLIGSLSNYDDDGTKKTTNLHIWQWKTVFLHALHVHFSSFDILKTFSFFLRREMTCFAVAWTTWAYDDKCSILSSYVPSAGSNLIPK